MTQVRQPSVTSTEVMMETPMQEAAMIADGIVRPSASRREQHERPAGAGLRGSISQAMPRLGPPRRCFCEVADDCAYVCALTVAVANATFIRCNALGV